MEEISSLKDGFTGNELCQYVIFDLGDDVFGISVKKIQEVIKVCEIKSIPNSMPYMKGVIDLRDTIIPIVDLRIKFNLEEKEYDRETSILITGIHGFLIGLVIDSILDVVDIEVSDLYNMPHLGLQYKEEIVQGVGKYNEEKIIVLDVDKIFKQDEIDSFK